MRWPAHQIIEKPPKDDKGKYLCKALLTFLSNAKCDKPAKRLLYYSDLSEPIARCQLAGVDISYSSNILFALNLKSYEFWPSDALREVQNMEVRGS